MNRVLFLLGRVGMIFLLSGLVVAGLAQISFQTSTFTGFGAELAPSTATIHPVMGYEGVTMRMDFEAVNGSRDVSFYVCKAPAEAYKYLSEMMGGHVPVSVVDTVLSSGQVEVLGKVEGRGHMDVAMEGNSSYVVIVANRGDRPIRFNVNMSLVSRLMPYGPAMGVAETFLGIGVLTVLYPVAYVRKKR